MKPTYESPLASRYASKYMLHLFSPDSRFETWRRLWVALAQAQHDLGLPVTQEQVDELAAHVSPIDYEVVSKKEKAPALPHPMGRPSSQDSSSRCFPARAGALCRNRGTLALRRPDDNYRSSAWDSLLL